MFSILYVDIIIVYNFNYILHIDLIALLLLVLVVNVFKYIYALEISN